MTYDNSTANQPIINTSTAIGLPDAIFDSTRQLALTVEFYFEYALLAIGIFGTAANALVLYALILHHAHEAKKRVVNLLIINQNLLDLSCCLLLVISISVRINNPHITGAFGYFLCATFVKDNATYCALFASIINLVALTVERYLKVVHPFWSKKRLKRWMIHAAIAFAWIGGIVSVARSAGLNMRVEDGICLSYFKSAELELILGTCSLAIFFLLPLIIFVYCYGCIVIVMRRQMRAMAGHSVEGTSAPKSASQAQFNLSRVISLYVPSSNVSKAFFTTKTKTKTKSKAQGINNNFCQRIYKVI